MSRVELGTVFASRSNMALGKGRAHQNDTLSKFRAERASRGATTSSRNMEIRKIWDRMPLSLRFRALTPGVMPCGDLLLQGE
jgi:hypothetical protein